METAGRMCLTETDLARSLGKLKGIGVASDEFA